MDTQQTKVCIVTGAASGIGLAIAQRLINDGHRVVACDIDVDRLKQSTAAIPAERLHLQPCDVTIETDVEAAVRAAMSRFGRLDVMVNNAGIIGPIASIHLTPTREWLQTVAVHLHGTFYGIKHAAAAMVEQQSGSIINMASTAGLVGGKGPHAYTTAKHGVVGLTKSAAAELSHFGVRVNAVAPSSIPTPFTADLIAGDAAAVGRARTTIRERSPLLGLGGTPEDIAAACAWLAGDESGYTTGLVLTADAGIIAGATPDGPAWRRYASVGDLVAPFPHADLGQQ